MTLLSIVHRLCVFIGLACVLVGLIGPAAIASGKKEHAYGPDDCASMPPGQAKKNPHCGSARKKGPPPWAPAHGRRHKEGKDTYVVEEEQVSIRIGNDIGITLGTCRRETIGAVLGGVVGGVIGNKVGDPSQKELTTVAGAVLGVLVGKSIGRQMDQKDQQCTGQVLERAADGDAVRWINEAGVTFNITPLETFEKGGLFCRKYQAVSTQAGKPQTVQQTACRQKDGTWKSS